MRETEAEVSPKRLFAPMLPVADVFAAASACTPLLPSTRCIVFLHSQTPASFQVPAGQATCAIFSNRCAHSKALTYSRNEEGNKEGRIRLKMVNRTPIITTICGHSISLE
jgi:hypothetical protein